MAFPAKKRELRSIVVNDFMFRWRFRTHQRNAILWIYGTSSVRTPLRVTFAGFEDSWTIIFPNSTIEPTEIGPAFTRRAIDFALENGWNSNARGAAFEIEWDGEKFRVLETARRNAD